MRGEPEKVYGFGADFGRVSSIALSGGRIGEPMTLHAVKVLHSPPPWTAEAARAMAEAVVLALIEIRDRYSAMSAAFRWAIPVVLEEPWLKPIPGRRVTDPEPILAHAQGVGFIAGYLATRRLDFLPLILSPAAMSANTGIEKDVREKLMPALVTMTSFGDHEDRWRQWRGPNGGAGDVPHVADSIFLSYYGCGRFAGGFRPGVTSP